MRSPKRHTTRGARMMSCMPSLSAQPRPGATGRKVLPELGDLDTLGARTAVEEL